MSSTAKAALAILALFVFGTMAAVTWGAWVVLDFIDSAPSMEHAERIVTIPRGASALRVARLLEDEGLVTDARKFYYLVRYKNVAPRIKAGEFRFFTDMKPKEVLEVLLEGEEVRYSLTFPEGYRVTEMAPVVSTLPWLNGDRFLVLCRDRTFIRALGFDTDSLEGYLFPSTYFVTRSEDEKALVQAMVRRFKQYWTSDKEARARELGMTMNQVVTLASIIEKESAHAEELPLIASVYHNRLARGMKLQADPTIIYGLENYDGNIRRKDILAAHPWNTYVIQGLPPTPIASPGAGALDATLHPARTDYLFFVARPDRTHDFSRTYEEHARKVHRYQVAHNRRR